MERRIEHAPHQQAEGAALKLISNLKLHHASSLIAPLAKAPTVLQMFERPIDIFHKNFKPFSLAGDAACKPLADGLVADLHVGDQGQYALLFLAPANMQTDA